MKNIYRLSAAAIAALAFWSCNDSDEPDTPTIDPVEFYCEVIDYSPAPGQFVNELPGYSSGDDVARMAEKAQQALARGELISLGAWGGSVTLRLSQPVTNGDGPDFRVKGNAYFAGVDNQGRHYGSSEPGIVYVMRDDNGNGKPDDTWYELRGEDYDRSVADFEVTYHRPALDATDATYIRWTASDGSEGYINRVSAYHLQNFFAEWVGKGDQTFKGRRLPDNAILDEATGYYRLYNLTGYADSYPDNDDGSKLDISSAVDAQGHPVQLDRVHFIKVVTGVLKCNGPLGESSTEIAGVELLEAV